MGIRPRKPEVLDAFGERIVAGFRFLLAGSALLIVYLDPFEPSPLIPLAYSILSFYTVYSAVCGSVFQNVGNRSDGKRHPYIFAVHFIKRWRL